MAASVYPSTREGYDYYDIDSILADEVLVPCVLTNGCTGVGAVIDPSSDGSALAPGTKVDLPLWMAPNLARRNLAQVGLPIFYGDRMRRKIKAGAGCEDLRVRCPFYYTAAERVHAAMEATGVADDSFPAFIMATFVGRYRELLAKAPVLESNAEASAVQAKLTAEELRLFNAAAEAAAAHDRYRANKDGSGLAAAGMKRKWGGGGGRGQENRRPAPK